MPRPAGAHARPSDRDAGAGRGGSVPKGSAGPQAQRKPRPAPGGSSCPGLRSRPLSLPPVEPGNLLYHRPSGFSRRPGCNHCIQPGHLGALSRRRRLQRTRQGGLDWDNHLPGRLLRRHVVVSRQPLSGDLHGAGRRNLPGDAGLSEQCGQKSGRLSGHGLVRRSPLHRR